MAEHKTELMAEVVVRTNGTSAEHERVVQWVADTLRSAPKRIQGGEVKVGVFDKGGDVNFGTSIFGQALPEVR